MTGISSVAISTELPRGRTCIALHHCSDVYLVN